MSFSAWGAPGTSVGILGDKNLCVQYIVVWLCKKYMNLCVEHSEALMLYFYFEKI